MKKTFIFFLFISFNLLAVDHDRLPAKIIKVTVFQNQAQLLSNVKGFAKAGNSTIIIENVSPNLDPQSIQIAGKGDIILMGTKFNNNYLGSKQSARMSQLTDSTRLLNEELKMVAFSNETFEREKDLLKTNYNTGTTTIANTADKVKAMADFFRIRMADIHANIIKNEKITNVLKEKLAKIQLQINELNEKKNQPVGEIWVNISAKNKTAFDLEITYIVQGAGWSPVYDIRVKDAKSPIAMNYKANVWQQTGLDWNDVKLSLSTTNPSQGGNKPVLFPQMVDFYQPMPHPMPRSKAMESRAMDNAAPAVMDEVMVTTSADLVTINESTLAVNFDITVPYTILSSVKPELVDIQNYDLTGNFKHYGIPKYDADAFLTTDIMGWELYNLLPGKANVYFEGAYVGETYLLDNSVKDTMNLSLGRDKKINFKREVIKDYTSKKAIGANIRESKAFRITIKNTKKEAVELVLEDQIPVSKNSEIEILDAEYKDAELNTETGKLTWKLNLRPSESKILEFKYIVKYPKGKTIVGN
jgi:uncharacterized protein (TIGR02231 family)